MNKVIVDAIGEQCPIPVVKATQALGQLQEGILEVHVDNETAVQNVMRMAHGKNLKPISEMVEQQHYVISMQVEGAAQATQEEILCAPDARGETVVAIGAATMGAGNDELGAILMKGFIYALSKLEQLPKTILFYNGGATLTVEGSVSLEDLKNMESQGVEILTCGTCLDFYKLKAKLAVGKVTNMYDIVERLSAAPKVIKP